MGDLMSFIALGIVVCLWLAWMGVGALYFFGGIFTWDSERELWPIVGGAALLITGTAWGGGLLLWRL